MVQKGTLIHTGCFTTMGKGEAYIQPIKQKLNINSSNDVELVRVDDVLTQVIWTRYFLKYQGYEIHDNVIYKDNHIAIKLENISIGSSIKCTRNINII